MEDKIILDKILDKAKQAESKGKIEYTDFLDMYQVALVKKFIAQNKMNNVLLYGGYENAERKVAIFYPNNVELNPNDSEILEIVRIKLGKGEKYTHRNYLGGIIKIGMKREKIGDILVAEDGADIIVKSETSKALAQELAILTRFQNSQISVEKIMNIRQPEIKVEEVNIIVPSLRLDSIVSDLAKTSRSKAVEILAQERVFVNGQQ